MMWYYTKTHNSSTMASSLGWHDVPDSWWWYYKAPHQAFGYISICTTWKVICPVGHMTTEIYMTRDNIYMTQVCGHASTHWGRVTLIFVSRLTIIGSDNGLLPGRRQAIIWTIAGKYCSLDPTEHVSMKLYLKFNSFLSRKWTWKSLRNDGHFVPASMC